MVPENSTAATTTDSTPSPEASDPRSRENTTTRFHDTPLANEAGFLIAKARELVNTLANQRLSPLGLKVRDFSVLSMACSGTQPSQRELGRFLDLDPSQVVSLVDRLERRGAVRREVDPLDRRSNILVSTEEGQILHLEAAKLIQQAHDELLSPLSQPERDDVLRLLSKITLRSALSSEQ